MAVSKRMTPVNVFGFVRYDQGNSHPSTNVKRQGGAINSGMAFDDRFNSRRQEGIRAARVRVSRIRNQQVSANEPHWHVIASKLGGPTKIENWGRNGQVIDVPPLTDLKQPATEASWHLGGGPLDPRLDGDGIDEYAHDAQPIAEAKAELAQATETPKKARAKRIPKAKLPKGLRPPKKLSKKGGFIFTKLYVPSVKP